MLFMSCRGSTVFCVPASQFSPVLEEGWKPGELAGMQHLMPSDHASPLTSSLSLIMSHFAVLTTVLVL